MSKTARCEICGNRGTLGFWSRQSMKTMKKKHSQQSRLGLENSWKTMAVVCSFNFCKLLARLFI